ncbi:MAG TPA: hypothetical protein VK421_20960 [Pyrinomonadaceae bacterium]|nr:hypothetical protein [Pyrinomonadaceae bacterium]
MEEQTQNLRAGESDPEKTVVADPEKTLVAPRFDAREVVTAQPVVPLADAPPARREQRQGTLPLLLILVSALVGGLVSVFAYRLYQQSVQQSAAREQRQPAAVEAPALTPEISAGAAVVETPAPAPEVIEEPEPTPAAEIAEVRGAAAAEEADEREEAREDKADRELEATRERATREERPATRNTSTTRSTPAPARRPIARRVEEITTPTGDLRVRRGRRDDGEASDYEVPTRTRADRRAARRDGERNIDRVRAIFEGPPPGR